MENYLVVSLILVWSFCLQRSYSAESALNFKLSSGEEISCVSIFEQPSLISLDHASNGYLKLRSEDDIQGPTLHRQPSPDSLPEEPASIASDKSTEEQKQVIPDEIEIMPAEQLFKTEVGTCPEGMIPILRNQRPLRRTRGISREGVDSIHGNYGHKLAVTSTNTSEADPAAANAGHEYAIDNHPWPATGLYRGANGYFNVWKPYVELSSEFSLSQLWITAGSYEQNNLNTIEVGWQVYKDIYGDDQPHLFVYWTRDAYKTTGCYNLACPGFVQTSSSLVVGGSLSSFVSVTNGGQYEIRVLVFWDQGTNAWWLNINGQNVGYWPNSLFTTLKSGATKVEWGGEIVNSETGNRHTQTDMGSGAFAQAGFAKAAYIRSLQTVNQQNQLVDAPLAPTDASATKVGCYSAQIFRDTSSASTWRTYLFFGGPGYSNACPT